GRINRGAHLRRSAGRTGNSETAIRASLPRYMDPNERLKRRPDDSRRVCSVWANRVRLGARRREAGASVAPGAQGNTAADANRESVRAARGKRMDAERRRAAV